MHRNSNMMLLYPSRLAPFGVGTFHFGDLSLGVLMVNYMVCMA